VQCGGSPPTPNYVESQVPENCPCFKHTMSLRYYQPKLIFSYSSGERKLSLSSKKPTSPDPPHQRKRKYFLSLSLSEKGKVLKT